MKAHTNISMNAITACNMRAWIRVITMVTIFGHHLWKSTTLSVMLMFINGIYRMNDISRIIVIEISITRIKSSACECVHIKLSLSVSSHPRAYVCTAHIYWINAKYTEASDPQNFNRRQINLNLIEFQFSTENFWLFS